MSYSFKSIFCNIGRIGWARVETCIRSSYNADIAIDQLPLFFSRFSCLSFLYVKAFMIGICATRQAYAYNHTAQNPLFHLYTLCTSHFYCRLKSAAFVSCLHSLSHLDVCLDVHLLLFPWFFSNRVARDSTSLFVYRSVVLSAC